MHTLYSDENFIAVPVTVARGSDKNGPSVDVAQIALGALEVVHVVLRGVGGAPTVFGDDLVECLVDSCAMRDASPQT